MVSEKKIFFSHYKSMEANDPRGMASLGHRSLIGRIYVGTLNIAAYQICKLWASWFQRRRFFLSFSHYKFMGANDSRGMASLDPRGLIGRIYVGDH